jgi:hypothetical protein
VTRKPSLAFRLRTSCRRRLKTDPGAIGVNFRAALTDSGMIAWPRQRLIVELTYGRCLAKARLRWWQGRSDSGCPRLVRETRLWRAHLPAAAGGSGSRSARE